MANIIGIEDLKKHLNTFKSISKIEVCEREASKRAIVIFNTDPVTQLLSFLDTQKEYEVARFAPFYVKVFLKGQNTKSENGVDLIGFTFAFEERNKPLQVNGPGTGVGVSQSDLYNIYSENGFYRAENRRLIEQVEDLECEIEELTEKLESPEASIGGTGQVKEWKEILGLVKDVFPGIGNIIGGNVAGALTSDPELNNIITELNLIDPMFKARMINYLNQVKNPQTSDPNASGKPQS